MPYNDRPNDVLASPSLAYRAGLFHLDGASCFPVAGIVQQECSLQVFRMDLASKVLARSSGADCENGAHNSGPFGNFVYQRRVDCIAKTLRRFFASDATVLCTAWIVGEHVQWSLSIKGMY